MSSGKPKTSKAKTKQAQSVYQGIDSFNVNLDGFANANATRVPGQALNMSSSLSPGLGRARDLSTEGLNNNLSFINQSPTQQLQDLNAGNNSLYNLQSELNRRLGDTQLGQAQSRFSSNGLENSTVRGAFEGQLATDARLQDLATRNASLDYQNTQARNNIATQNQTLGNLANIQMLPLQMAQQNALAAFNNVDQTSQFNAGQSNQASMFNAGQSNQAAQQAAANQQSLIGNLIGAGASLAAIPLTGGMSGLGALSSLSSLGARSLPTALAGAGALNIGGGLSRGGFLQPYATSNPFINRSY